MIDHVTLRVRDYAFREPRAANPRPVLLSAARFIEKKGLIYALQAARILRDRNFDFEYRIIGSGPLRPELEAFVLRHGLGDRVEVEITFDDEYRNGPMHPMPDWFDATTTR